MFINKYFKPLHFRNTHNKYLTPEEIEEIKTKEIEKILKNMLQEHPKNPVNMEGVNLWIITI